MKKFIYSISVILILLCALFAFSPRRIFRTAAESGDTIIYAQIKNPAMVYVKDEENPDTYTPVVTLPATYFVALLSDERDGYYYVSYLDITGYVKSGDLEKVDFEPVYKYASPCFTAANEGLSAILRKSPNHDADTVALIPDGEKMTFYGTIDGSVRFEGASKVWYYVKYARGDEILYGYVYSYHGVADPVPDNIIEKVPILETPPNEQEPDTQEPPASLPRLESKYEAIFIVCLCLPAVVIMFMLFRRDPKEKKKKVPRG